VECRVEAERQTSVRCLEFSQGRETVQISGRNAEGVSLGYGTCLGPDPRKAEKQWQWTYSKGTEGIRHFPFRRVCSQDLLIQESMLLWPGGGVKFLPSLCSLRQ
jgi:hypothetical protein